MHHRIENHTKNAPGRLLFSAGLEPPKDPSRQVLHVPFSDIKNEVTLGRVIVVECPLADRRSYRDIRQRGIGDSPFPNEARRHLENVFAIGRSGLALTHISQSTAWTRDPSIFRLAADETGPYNIAMSNVSPPEGRKLYKSRVNRKIAGVCGGLGEFFDVDPALIRLGLVLLVIFGGTGILLYIIAALILDDNPYQ